MFSLDLELATTALSPLADCNNLVVMFGDSPFVLTCDTCVSQQRRIRQIEIKVYA